MGFGFFATFLILSLVFRNSFSQEPNTDGFYVSAFFTRMGKELHLLTHGFPSPICSWSWVSCDAQMNHVISLFASGLNLSGPIPDNTIGKLTKLQALDLSNNGITGFSADFWGLGGSLISLNLSRNMIDGLLSNNIGNFGRLESLDLSYNNFSGEIPVAVGSLLCLKILNLSGNGFEGVIPHGISGCISLTYMDVSMNKLYGTIPDSFGAGFYNMRGLNLSFNFFQGSVAGVFQGPLEIVDLSNNQFQGYISKVNSSSSFNRSSLIYLDLSSNQFSGEFFTDLSRAQSLKHLDLAFNRFSHQNLSNITNLSHLKYLNLSRTNLVGRIPIEISNLSDLSTLDLSHNSLSGLVPDLSARNLRILDLSSNNLTGEIPVPLQQQLPDLQRFNFSYNNLTFCPNQLPPKALNSSFIGSRITCPIAAEPDHIITNRIKRRGLKLALAILLTAFFLIAALICLAFGFFRAPRTRSWEAKQLSFNGQEQNFSIPLTLVPVIIFEKPLLNFNFTDLLNATSNFDRETLLSEGRYGPVYGGFLPGGIRVAVKVLVHSSTLNNEEVLRELERLGRTKHPNLVSLMGYCLAGDQRITIYEYMENGNLENLLHDLPLGVHTPDIWEEEEEEQDQRINTWRFRHKVALGIARALAYLHHGCFPQIVHRDVKAGSVYLDSNFEPRLSDFGLEKVVGSDFDDEVTKGSSSGYIAPEFFESGVESQTSKSDVYGFGVILFELITGKKAIGDRYPDEKEKSLVGWGRALVKKNQGLMAIDPKIRRSGSMKQMEEALRIAYLCTADLPLKRPSMQQIVGLLKDLEPIVGDQ